MLIAHRCLVCGHPDYYNLNSAREGSIIHGGRKDGVEIRDPRLVRRRCNTPECLRCASFCDWGEPVLITRFKDGAYGEQVTWLVEPGGLLFGALHGLAKQYACACDDCQVFYVGCLAMQEDGSLRAEPAATATATYPAHDPGADAEAAETTDNAAADLVPVPGQEGLF